MNDSGKKTKNKFRNSPGMECQSEPKKYITCATVIRCYLVEAVYDHNRNNLHHSIRKHQSVVAQE